MIRHSLFTLAALLGPASAWALTCPTGPVGVNIDTRRPVPTNARFLVELHDVAVEEDIGVRLKGPKGVDVPLKVERREASHMVVSPEAPLHRNTIYQLWNGEEGQLDVTFRTGAGPDERIPERPLVLEVGRDRYTSRLGPIDRMRVVVEQKTDAHHWEVELSEDLMFAHPQRVYGTDPTVDVGRSICRTNAAWYDGAQDYYVRVRAVDAAGNPSEWVILPRSPGSAKEDP